MYISPNYKPERVTKRYISIEHGTNVPLLGETDNRHLWIQIRPMTEEEKQLYTKEIAEAKGRQDFFPNWVGLSA